MEPVPFSATNHRATAPCHSCHALQFLLVTMATPATDSRNLEWKSNNVGSKLLAKMGWKDGQAVGKRQKEGEAVTSEGIRIKRRADGLGLGASTVVATNNSNHVGDFSSLLENLKSEHKSTEKKKKKKKKSVMLPTNKSTHHKVRAAKFQEKTQEDLKSIFAVAGGADFPVTAATTSESKAESKSKRKSEDGKKKKKKRKRES